MGSKALLAGSISSLGNQYVIALNAINCATGDSIVEEQTQAAGKEQVLKALNTVAVDMRGKLENPSLHPEICHPGRGSNHVFVGCAESLQFGMEDSRHKGRGRSSPVLQAGDRTRPQVRHGIRSYRQYLRQPRGTCIGR